MAGDPDDAPGAGPAASALGGCAHVAPSADTRSAPRRSTRRAGEAAAAGADGGADAGADSGAGSRTGSRAGSRADSRAGFRAGSRAGCRTEAVGKALAGMRGRSKGRKAGGWQDRTQDTRRSGAVLTTPRRPDRSTGSLRNAMAGRVGYSASECRQTFVRCLRPRTLPVQRLRSTTRSRRAGAPDRARTSASPHIRRRNGHRRSRPLAAP